MNFILYDAEPGAGGSKLIETNMDKVSLVVICVIIPIITIFAIVKIYKIYKRKEEDNKE